MNKVQKFELFIRENPDLNVFEKVQQNDAVLFKSRYTFAGSEKIFLIVLDDSVFSQVLCRIVTLNNPAKRDKILYLINELNSKYKALKYTLDDLGNIDFCIDYIASDEDFNAKTLIGIILNIFKNIEEDYGKFMRVIWA
ncbi:hypothetical protein [Defluviitalea phaphyphila]|uniref:hypothetical protein n=1 Tax=Defluviitalea phaphyphila TaxID=1473580 RepID=UPI000731A26C|nr:hypothetical protein [Defluviitalea phaphyphila]